MKAIKYFMLLVTGLAAVTAAAQQQRIRIKVVSDANDSLVIRYGISGNAITPDFPYRTAQPTKNNTFLLQPGKGERLTYFTLMTPGPQSRVLINNFIAEPGDDITITHRPGALTVTGQGSEKYNCWLALFKRPAAVMDALAHLNAEYDKDRVKGYRDQLDSLRVSYYPEDLSHVAAAADIQEKYKLNTLAGYKAKLTLLVYNVFRANILAERENSILKMYKHYYQNMPDGITDSYRLSVQTRLLSAYEELEQHDFSGFPATTLSYAQDYVNFIINKQIAPGASTDIVPIFTRQFSPALADQLIARFYSSHYSQKSIPQQQLEQAIAIVQTPYYRDCLEALYASSRKGMVAHDFNLPDTSGKRVQLSAFRGKVVVLDFSFTGCSGCKGLTFFMTPIVRSLKSDTSVVFISISVDQDRSTWIKSASRHEYSPAGSLDLYTEGLGPEHPVVKAYRVFGYPTLLVIDKKGKIFSANPRRPGTKQATTAFLETIKAAGQ